MKNLNQLILDEIAAGHITCRKHPTLDLFVLNYAPSVSYDRRWNEATLQCRGLIVDGVGNIIARPFRKFFNLGEHTSPDLPDVPIGEQFIAYEKLDGSLGITYLTPTGLAISTRGSFESEQALRGTQILREKYGHLLPQLDSELTYLFEIIYPENRIVISYDDERLVILGAIRTLTGEEVFPHEIEWPHKPQVFQVDSLDDLPMDTANFEGYVVRFESGLRVKVKLDEYVRLHRLVCDMTPRRIWELLRSGDDVKNIIKCVPDELHKELDGVIANLCEKFDDVCYDHLFSYEDLQLNDLASRRDQALAIVARCQRESLNPSALFCLLDEKQERFKQLMWDRVRP